MTKPTPEDFEYWYCDDLTPEDVEILTGSFEAAKLYADWMYYNEK